MKASELMTKDPAVVHPDDTVREAASRMERNDCGCLPVVENGNSGRLVGVVTDRDIATRAVGHGRGPDTQVSEIMSADPHCCRSEDDVATVQQIMAEEQVRRVPVVDQDGRPVGMIAQADLARAAEYRVEVSDSDLAHVVERVSAPKTTE